MNEDDETEYEVGGTTLNDDDAALVVRALMRPTTSASRRRGRPRLTAAPSPGTSRRSRGARSSARRGQAGKELVSRGRGTRRGRGGWRRGGRRGGMSATQRALGHMLVTLPRPGAALPDGEQEEEEVGGEEDADDTMELANPEEEEVRSRHGMDYTQLQSSASEGRRTQGGRPHVRRTQSSGGRLSARERESLVYRDSVWLVDDEQADSTVNRRKVDLRVKVNGSRGRVGRPPGFRLHHGRDLYDDRGTSINYKHVLHALCN